MERLLKASALGLALLLVPSLAWAQEGTVAGTITDQDGQPLPGASVRVAGTSIGSAADTSGSYRVTGVPTGEQTLEASFVGYETAQRTIEVSAGETVRVDFQLQRGAAQLEEVQVTGYQTADQAAETAASGNVSADKIEEMDVSSADQALQGEVAGVRVTSQSGQPGSAIQVRVRGQGSITGGNSPLFIIDGVQVSTGDTFGQASGNPLANLDPGDIQNIRVLRGAHAASIYGASASNGVVLISTKTGRAGDTEINFSSSIGRSERLKEFDMMSLDEWADYTGTGHAESINRLFGRDFLSPQQGRELTFTNEGCPLQAVPSSLRPTINFFCNTPFSAGGLSLGSTADSLRTNWPDRVYRKAYSQEYDLSFSGGDENTRFFVSGRYTFDQGQILDSKLWSGGLRVNVEQDVADWLTVSSKVDVSSLTVRGTIEDGPFINSPFWASYFIPPNTPVYQQPNEPSSGFRLQPNFVFSFNPVAQEKFNDTSSNNTAINGSTTFEWDLGGGFSARTLVGLQWQDQFENDYEDPRLPAYSGIGGEQSLEQDRELNYNASHTFNYSNTFGGQHTVSGLVGTEFRKEQDIDTGESGRGFPNNLFRTLQSAAEPTGVFYSETEYRQLSFFTDLSYTYDRTYQIRTTVRLDGNSRFGENNRWGTFGSVAAYWRLSEEEFLQDVGFLTDLKLRASYAEVGNNQIDNFQSRRLFGSAGEYLGTSGIAPQSLGNVNLTWEEKREVNVGLDWALFGGRVSGSVDAYRNNTDRLLLNRDLPLDSGFGSFIDNVGKLRNQGLEIELETTNIDRAFQWRTTFNIAFQDSEVRKLLPDDREINAGGVYRVGRSPDQFELVPFEGVNPANGVPLYKDANGNLTYDWTDTEDNRLVGNTNANFYGGLTNQFSYKGLSAEVFFQYDYGRETFNNDAYFLNANTFYFLRRSGNVLDYWEQPGDVTDTPKPTGFFDTFGPIPANGFGTTRWFEDASYIRLKRVRVSYSLPSSFLQQIPELSGISLFVAGRNLVTFSEYNGFDPEGVGVDLGSYPQATTFTAGLDVTL